MTTTSLVRLLAASAVGVLLGGCVAVPADPYYDAAPAYPTYPGTYPQTYPNAYPVYPMPHPGYDARAAERERWEQNRDRQAWREREQRQERERALQERRDQQEREASQKREQRDEQARRERDQRNHQANERRDELRRQQTERERRAQEGRTPSGERRTDYDRYNPSNGRWMPRQEDMP